MPDQCCEQHGHGKQHGDDQLEQQQVDIVHCSQDFDECDGYEQLDADIRIDSDKQHGWWMFGITVSEWRDVH